MDKYITKFETTSEFATNSGDTSIIARPHVSLTMDNYKVHYIKQPDNTIRYTAISKISFDSSDFYPLSVVSHTFENGMGAITFDGELTEIPERAFQNVTALRTIIIPKKVTEIGSNAFDSCTGLTSVEFPKSLITIGMSAFDGCKSITNITLPDSLETIEQYAFNDCSGATSVTISSSVTKIYSAAFWYCTNLTSITCYAKTPPALSYTGSTGRWFDNTNNCPIYVPSRSVDVYKQPYRWAAYESRIQAIP